MIGDIAQDLVTKVKTVTGFGTAPVRVSLAVGGKQIDPTMQKVTLPAAWVVYTGDEILSDDDQGQCAAYVRLNFIVKILIDYSTETDLINVQLPVLEAVKGAVNAQQGPVGSKKWKYEGESIDEISSNRLVFDQRYSIVTIL